MTTFSPSLLPSLTLSHAHAVVSPRPLILSLSHTCLFSLSRSLISTLMISPSPFTLSLPHLTSLLLSLSRYCSNSIFTLKLILSFSRTIPFDQPHSLTTLTPSLSLSDIFFHGILSHTVYPYSLFYPLTLQLSLSLASSFTSITLPRHTP